MEKTFSLPFDLVDPVTKTILKDNGNGLYCENKLYSYITLPEYNKTIIDFNPHCSINNGAYQNESELDKDLSNLHPTKAPFVSCYKDLAMKRLNKYLQPEDVVVDLGCSNTEVLNNMPDNLIKIGVDISYYALFDRTPNALDSNVNNLWICNATELPIPDSSIDCVLCCDIAEHLLSPEILLKEVYRILKPRGKLMISVPNLVSMGNRISFLLGNGKGLQLAQLLKLKNPYTSITGPRFPDQKEHLRWFTSQSLQKFILSNNFSIISRFGIGPIISRLKVGSFTHNISHLIGIIAEKK